MRCIMKIKSSWRTNYNTNILSTYLAISSIIRRRPWLAKRKFIFWITSKYCLPLSYCCPQTAVFTFYKQLSRKWFKMAINSPLEGITELFTLLSKNLINFAPITRATSTNISSFKYWILFYLYTRSENRHKRKDKSHSTRNDFLLVRLISYSPSLLPPIPEEEKRFCEEPVTPSSAGDVPIGLPTNMVSDIILSRTGEPIRGSVFRWWIP